MAEGCRDQGREHYNFVSTEPKRTREQRKKRRKKNNLKYAQSHT